MSHDRRPLAEHETHRRRPGDALVKPATAEREATQHDEDIEKAQLDDAPVVPGEQDAP